MNIDEKLSEQILKEKNEKLKRNTNRFLVSFLIIFFSGYLIFFSSKLWLPNTYNDVTVTPLGEEIEVQNRKIRIDKWAYSPESREMEIILEIENLSSDGINEYKFTLFDRGTGAQEIRQTINTTDFIVLRATLSRRWSELSFRISAKDPADELSTMKFYTTKKSIEIEEPLQEKTPEAYRREICDIRIRKIESEIAEKSEEIEKQRQTMNNAKEAAENLIEKAEYKTYEEREESLQNAEKLMQERASAQSSMETLQDEIAEMRKQIQLQEELKEKAGEEK